MSKVSNEELFRSTLVEMESTYHRKNADYGNSFEEMYRKVGAIYPLIHLSEKLARIEQLTQSDKGPRVTEESLRDSLLDLANYSVMWITELDKDRLRRGRFGYLCGAEREASKRGSLGDLFVESLLDS